MVLEDEMMHDNDNYGRSKDWIGKCDWALRMSDGSHIPATPHC